MRNALLLIVPLLAGCASSHAVPEALTRQELLAVELAIDPMVQADAPVQIVSITPNGDNLLATVTVKSNTDRPVMDFYVAWSVFRPANCALGSPDPHLRPMSSGSQSAHAEDRRPGETLPPGATWGARALRPHEESDITSLLLSRDSLLKMAREFNAKKVRVQVGVPYANYSPPPGTTVHIGPDWRDENWEHAQNIFDPEDVTRQACKQ
jgi:hypothetical protein